MFICLSLQFADTRLFNLDLYRGKQHEHMATLKNTQKNQRMLYASL